MRNHRSVSRSFALLASFVQLAKCMSPWHIPVAEPYNAADSMRPIYQPSPHAYYYLDPSGWWVLAPPSFNPQVYTHNSLEHGYYVPRQPIQYLPISILATPPSGPDPRMWMLPHPTAPQPVNRINSPSRNLNFHPHYDGNRYGRTTAPVPNAGGQLFHSTPQTVGYGSEVPSLRGGNVDRRASSSASNVITPEMLQAPQFYPAETKAKAERVRAEAERVRAGAERASIAKGTNLIRDALNLPSDSASNSIQQGEEEKNSSNMSKVEIKNPNPASQDTPTFEVQQREVGAFASIPLTAKNSEEEKIKESPPNSSQLQESLATDHTSSDGIVIPKSQSHDTIHAAKPDVSSPSEKSKSVSGQDGPRFKAEQLEAGGFVLIPLTAKKSQEERIKESAPNSSQVQESLATGHTSSDGIVIPKSQSHDPIQAAKPDVSSTSDNPQSVSGQGGDTSKSSHDKLSMKDENALAKAEAVIKYVQKEPHNTETAPIVDKKAGDSNSNNQPSKNKEAEIEEPLPNSSQLQRPLATDHTSSDNIVIPKSQSHDPIQAAKPDVSSTSENPQSVSGQGGDTSKSSHDKLSMKDENAMAKAEAVIKDVHKEPHNTKTAPIVDKKAGDSKSILPSNNLPNQRYDQLFPPLDIATLRTPHLAAKPSPQHQRASKVPANRSTNRQTKSEKKKSSAPSDSNLESEKNVMSTIDTDPEVVKKIRMMLNTPPTSVHREGTPQRTRQSFNTNKQPSVLPSSLTTNKQDTGPRSTKETSSDSNEITSRLTQSPNPVRKSNKNSVQSIAEPNPKIIAELNSNSSAKLNSKSLAQLNAKNLQKTETASAPTNLPHLKNRPLMSQMNADSKDIASHKKVTHQGKIKTSGGKPETVSQQSSSASQKSTAPDASQKDSLPDKASTSANPNEQSDLTTPAHPTTQDRKTVDQSTQKDKEIPLGSKTSFSAEIEENKNRKTDGQFTSSIELIHFDDEKSISLEQAFGIDPHDLEAIGETITNEQNKPQNKKKKNNNKNKNKKNNNNHQNNNPKNNHPNNNQKEDDTSEEIMKQVVGYYRSIMQLNNHDSEISKLARRANDAASIGFYRMGAILGWLANDQHYLRGISSELYFELKKSWLTDPEAFKRTEKIVMNIIGGAESIKRVAAFRKQLLQHTISLAVARYLGGKKESEEANLEKLYGITKYPLRPVRIPTTCKYQTLLIANSQRDVIKKIFSMYAVDEHLDTMEYITNRADPAWWPHYELDSDCFERGIDALTVIKVGDALQFGSKVFWDKSSLGTDIRGRTSPESAYELVLEIMSDKRRLLPWHESAERDWLKALPNDMYEERLKQLSSIIIASNVEGVRDKSFAFSNRVESITGDVLIEDRSYTGFELLWLDRGLTLEQLKEEIVSGKSLTLYDRFGLDPLYRPPPHCTWARMKDQIGSAFTHISSLWAK